MLFSPLYASARLAPLAGGVRLGYMGYKMSESGSKGEDADSFSQQYSLVATQSGNLYNRRGGPYKLMLTYDHLQYMTDINGVEYSPSSSFFGWDGDLRLNMPHLHGLDLTIYSSKMRAVLPAEDFSLDGFFTDLNSIDTRRSGFKLRLGVNGGPYYHLYQNSYDRVDDEGLNNRFGRLGMSINSGVNWLHLYRDKESLRGTEKQTFVFGNVGLPTEVSSIHGSESYLSNNSNSRLWHRLTNWLDISADFLYSDEENDDDDISTKRATVAFKGDVGRARIGSYTVHERVDSDSQSSRRLSLPFWANYRFTPTTVLYFYNNYSESKTEDLDTLSTARNRSLTDSLTLTSNLGKELFLETGYDLKKSADPDVRIESHSIYFEGYTRRKERLDYSFSYRYDTDMVDNGTSDGRSSYSHLLGGSVTYRLTQKTRLRLSQAILSAYQRDIARYERFVTSFNIDHISSNTSRSYLDLSRTAQLNEGGTESLQNRISASLKKEMNSRLNLRIAMIYGDDKNDLRGVNEDSSSLALRADMMYKVARRFESDTSLKTNQSDKSGQPSVSDFEFAEELKYSYNRKGFSKRKLFDLAGAVRYKKRKVASSSYDEDWLELKFNYYPALMFSCGASYASQNDSEIVGKNLYFSFNYPLLTFKGNYGRRLNKGSDQEEDHYNIDFTKRF